MKIISITGALIPQQFTAVQAVNNIYEKVCNQDHFSRSDSDDILNEIKSVHALCKDSFGGSMLSWQVDRYQLQMYLENEYKFIFNDEKMTWTASRWENAIIHELAIQFYRIKVLEVYDFQLRLMGCWLLFQYFNTTVFNGHHCEEIIKLTFKIVQECDIKVELAKADIKQWREKNDDKIRAMNSSRTEWRREIARCQRLVNGCMKSTEVQLYHMVAVSLPQYPFEVNIKRVASALGLSNRIAVRRGKEIGFTAESFPALIFFHDEYKAEYDKERKWSEKVLNNTLSKKEKNEFWKRHRIYNNHTPFRTFSTPEPDLIPAENPLETSDEKHIEKASQEGVLPIDPSEINRRFQKMNTMPSLIPPLPMPFGDYGLWQ